MKVLVIGEGGREHAIAWKIAKSVQVTEVYVSPGNAGTLKESKIININLGDRQNMEGLLDFALNEKIDLTIVGPEQFLVDGIVDLFESNGLKIIGPTKSAARLEGSKNFAKSFMKRYSIPTANYESFTESFEAKKYVKSQNFPIVIKADGLASGKGVAIVKSLTDANFVIDEYLEKKRFGSSGTSIVVEEFVSGREVSFIVLTDGKTIFTFPTSQDHKRLLDNDQGPNTGGMGAYSPVNFIDEKLNEKIINQVMRATIDGMDKDGNPYKGFLYAGLMILPNNDIRVLEYNCRLGDPEAQILMMKMKGDFFDVLRLSVNEHLSLSENYVDFWDERSSLGVVTASEGYPENPELGKKIKISPKLNFDHSLLKIFHAGTTLKDGELETSGGRVLCVSVLENNLSKAREKVYLNLKKIHFDGMQYRGDIAKNIDNLK